MASFSIKQMTLQDYWRVFVRRKWMIFLPAMLVLGVAIPGVQMMTPIYQATTSLIPEELKAGEVLEEVSRIKSPRAERIDTAKEKLLSQSYLLKVAERTKLLDSLPPETRTSLKHEHELVDYMRHIIRLGSRGGIIYVTAEHPDPHMAMLLANAVAEVYVESTEENRRKVTGKSYEFLNEQLARQEQVLRQAEDAYREAMEKRYADSLKSEDTGIVGELKQLRQTKVTLELELAQARNELDAARSMDRSKPASNYVDPRVVTLEAEIAGLQTELERLLVSFTEEWPEVVRKREEIARLQNELLEARAHAGVQMTRKQRVKYWEDKVRSLSSQLASVDTSINAREKLLASLPAVQMELERLKRDMDAAAETYTLLKTQRDAAMLTQAAELENLGQVAEILDRAIEPRQPVKPNKKKYYMLALALGLLIGTGTAFLAEYFDQSIHTAEDIREYLGVPVLGTIPDARQGNKPNLVTWTPAFAGLLAIGVLFTLAIMDMLMSQILSQPSVMSRLAGLMFH